ncbi:MAG: cystathionine gamma-synthase family protein [Bacteroidetes bacterium]|nr:cystathionine gamma-synthase family protein [Bacteroidota bacterium]
MKTLHPESLMMSYGYKSASAQGAIKCPVYLTSTFEFESAEEGKAYFEKAYHLTDENTDQDLGMIYSRINNPNMEILEKRLCLWDQAEDAAVFESGMAAISTVFMEFLSPGDVFLYSTPVYGGTGHFITEILSKFGITGIGFSEEMEIEELKTWLLEEGLADRLAMIYIETPANPTNSLYDIGLGRELADAFSSKEKKVMVVVDNTYMGPLWQNPLSNGADLVVYSATKYIAGHSDVIAGACLGSKELIGRVKTLRTFMGNMASPWTCWMLMRSLETLKVRMEKQAFNAEKIARFLNTHPKVEKVLYPGLLKPEDGKAFEIFQKQCSSPGAMISILVKGGEAEAFKFINSLQLVKLAVSLGSTESLIQHPATMTHAGMSPEDKIAYGITENLVRLSVGVENEIDLLNDIEQALEKIESPILVKQIL